MRHLAAAILLAACGSKAPAPKPSPAPSASERTLVANAEAMQAAVCACEDLDKIPQATRDAARQGLDAMKQGWGDVRDLPPDVVFDTAEACVASVHALEAGAAELGCAL